MEPVPLLLGFWWPDELVSEVRRLQKFWTDSPGAGFMKGLKSGLRLKSETLGSNIVNILLSLWTQTQSISQTGST